jgi:exopolysaccharide biosynthesis protein
MRDNREVITNVQAIVADLDNPYVTLNVMTGQTGQITQRENVTLMSRNTGAVAGVNGDFFNISAEGAPLGPQIASGKLMASPTTLLQGMYAFGITKDRRPMIEMFTFQGLVMAVNGQSYPISGVNRTYGWFDGVHSHGNAIHLYTSDWGSVSRANDGATTPTEVLVVGTDSAFTGGVVAEIALNGTLNKKAPENGYILRAAGRGAAFVAANLKIGDVIATPTSLLPLNTNLALSGNDFSMLLGGHTILVSEGQAAAFSRDVTGIQGTSATSRTGVGYTQDGRYVYMVTADHAGDSVGPTLAQFQQILLQMGLWRALNLDGGGSTTMVSRPLGEFQAQLSNVPKDGAQRKVVNGLGVYTLAPAGELQGLIVSGPSFLWKGERAQYAVKAFDTFYNPLDPLGLGTQFSAVGEHVMMQPNGEAIAQFAGVSEITAAAGDRKPSLQVEVADRASIARLDLVPSKPPSEWKIGDQIRLQAKATLQDGREFSIPTDLLQWELFGVRGVFQAGTFRYEGFVQEPGVVTPSTTAAMLVARYDRFSTRLVIPTPPRVWITDFQQVPWLITSEAFPNAAQAAVSLTSGMTGKSNDLSLSLSYDFRSGDGVTDFAAYAKLNGSAGIEVPKNKPSALQLDVMGDGQGGWLRVEFTDPSGAFIRKTIAERIDWQGLRTIDVSLNDINPSSLKRIYIVSKKPIAGVIGVDNMSWVYPSSQRTVKIPTAVELTVDVKQATVNATVMALDQPPKIIDGRTYVPVRFVVDALGGRVQWEAAEKKVVIRRGEDWMELWVGDPIFLVNGSRVNGSTAPLISGGRTLLPLRVISEQLGMKVVWEPKSKKISIQS